MFRYSSFLALPRIRAHSLTISSSSNCLCLTGSTMTCPPLIFVSFILAESQINIYSNSHFGKNVIEWDGWQVPPERNLTSGTLQASIKKEEITKWGHYLVQPWLNICPGESGSAVWHCFWPWRSPPISEWSLPRQRSQKTAALLWSGRLRSCRRLSVNSR